MSTRTDGRIVMSGEGDVNDVVVSGDGQVTLCCGARWVCIPSCTGVP